MTAKDFPTHFSRSAGSRCRGPAAHGLLRIACVLFLLFAGMATAPAAMSVEASVEKNTMAVGQTNAYTITIRGSSGTPRMGAPSVPGLTFSTRPSTHSSIGFVNGVGSRETKFSWSFQAERPGRFVIPAQEIQIDNQRIRIDEVTVEVREASQELRNRFALRWKVPEGPFYVGQAIPATLQLFVRSGINAGLGSPPDGSSEQFIRTEFSNEPRQRQEMVDGQPFTVVEWDTVITPIRSGPGDLSMSLVLVYETGEVRRDSFFSHAVQEQLRLTTEAANWDIRGLPRADRPESFSGAVGKFDVEAKLSRNELEVGDPITFSLEVRGEGNFERMQAPEVPETDGWRIYPPRAQMKQEGVPYRGVKTFEYILTPTSETVQEAPAVAFSWFDPAAASWQEVEVAPQPVEVQAGPRPSTRDRVAETDDGETYSQTGDNNGLYPLATSAGNRRTLLPPWRQPVFWAVNGGMGCLMAFGLVGLLRNRKAAQNPYLQVRSEAARKAKDLATEAIKAADRHDALTFYTQARQSLRHFLATLEPQTHNPESLTWEDLEMILRAFTFSEDSLTRMRELFGRKDAVQFAGWKPTDEELRADRTSFETLLNEIVTHKR